MDTQPGRSEMGKKTRLWRIARKPVRPISLVIAMLAVLATVLGVIGLSVSSGSVLATPGSGVSAELLGRATLGPFRVNQPPDFLIHSRDDKDIAVQKVTIATGGHSGWHTHPGLSLAIVTSGQVKVTRLTKEGCVEQVYGPDEVEQAFYEVADEVHIAENVGAGDAVIYVMRLNFPVAGAFTDSSPANPGC